jgi:hypothetical protein
MYHNFRKMKEYHAWYEYGFNKSFCITNEQCEIAVVCVDVQTSSLVHEAELYTPM